MKGCEGWTWADDETGRAGDTEEGLLRSWAETQGCTAPGRSTEVGRIDSLLVVVLLELLVLPLEDKSERADESPGFTRCSPLQGVWLKLLTRVNSSSVGLRPSSTAGSSDFSPDPPAVPGYPGHAHSPHLCLISPAPSCSLSVTTCCLYCCGVKQVTHTRVLEAILMRERRAFRRLTLPVTHALHCAGSSTVSIIPTSSGVSVPHEVSLRPGPCLILPLSSSVVIYLLVVMRA